MDDTRKRIVIRFRQTAGNVIPMGQPKRPKTPLLLIHGRKYVTSDYWPMGSSITDAMAPPEGGGAKLLDGGGNRYRYLWLYNTDKGYLAMWRHSDGDEKTYERASSSMHVIYALEKKGQLNRVTNEEFVAVDREMKHRQDETMKNLKETIAEMEDEWDHRVTLILKNYFDKNVRPEINRRLAEAARGVIPFGFKVNEERLQHKSREDQLRTFIVTDVLSKFTQDMAYEVVTKDVGFDAYEPPEGDSQAVQWAWHDLHEKTYDEYLR